MNTLLFKLIAISLFLFASPTFTAPVWGELFTIEQPDGSKVSVKIWGDEFYQTIETTDGYTLMKDAEGWITYAALSENGDEYISTNKRYLSGNKALSFNETITTSDGGSIKKGIRISRESVLQKVEVARLEMASNTPYSALAGSFSNSILKESLSGQVQGLTIIIAFPDEGPTFSRTEIESHLNTVGESGDELNPSVRDYFYDVSNGHVDYTNYVTNYYTAKKPKSYYDNTELSSSTRARELVLEALEHLRDVENLDFSQFDSNDDGDIDAINIYYVGYNRGVWAKGLWPHQSSISGFSADGVEASEYQITNMGGRLLIGTFCHENGHMLFGWPDLYDYDYNSEGTGGFDIMSSSGGSNPVSPNPHFRHKEGWITPTVITNTTIEQYTATANDPEAVFYYQNPSNANESYYWEVIKQTGRNVAMPGEGVLVWHVDIGSSNNYEHMLPNMHYYVTVVQADNRWDLEHHRGSGNGYDLYYENNNSELSMHSEPQAQWWDGTPSALVLKDISAIGDEMSFSVENGEVSRQLYLNKYSTLNFSNTEPSIKNITVYNNGSQETTINDITFSSPEFSLVNPAYPLLVPAQDSLVISVECIPLNTEDREETISFMSDAQNRSQIDVSLSLKFPLDLALNKSFEYGTQHPFYPAAYMFDGDDATEWNSLENHGQKIMVDLGNYYTIEQIVLRWGDHIPEYYQIGYGTNRSGYYYAHTELNVIGGVDNITVPATGIRYVYLITGPAQTGEGISLKSFEVYGSAIKMSPPELTSISISPKVCSPNAGETQQFTVNGFDQYSEPIEVVSSLVWNATYGGTIDDTGLFTAGSHNGHTTISVIAGYGFNAHVTCRVHSFSVSNVARRKPAKASSTQDRNYSGYAFDDAASYWKSGESDSEWISVDLLGFFNIESVTLTWGSAYGKDYTIETSSNGIDWDIVHTEIEGNGGSDTRQVSAQRIRYVRMKGTNAFRDYGYILSNFSVMGVPHIDDASVVTSLEVSPKYTRIKSDELLQLQVNGFDQYDQEMDVDVVWNVSVGATINALGEFTAQSEGVYTTTAQYGAVSDVVNITVFESGDNLIANGDFSWNLDGWIHRSYQGAASESSIIKGACVIDISDKGSDRWHVQLRQPNVPMIEGTVYKVQFDAKATADRSMRVRVEKDIPPYTEYSNEKVSLSTTTQTVTYEFTMNENTDMNSRFAFFLGSRSADVTIDNVVLEVVTEAETPVVSSIVISPVVGTLQAGDTYQFSALAYDQYANKIDARLAWSVIGGAAEISDEGLLIALSPGSALQVSAHFLTIEETVTVAVLGVPEHNILKNGDFATNLDFWEVRTYDDASASANWDNHRITSQTSCRVYISNKGDKRSYIQLRQTGVALTKGSRYRVRFKAKAYEPRSMRVKLKMNSTPYTDYSNEKMSLTNEYQAFEYEFTMEEETDHDTRFTFYLGDRPASVYVDDVILEKVI